MMKIERIADKLLMAGQRLGYRNARGEKRGQKNYDENLSAIKTLKQEMKKAFENGTWKEIWDED